MRSLPYFVPIILVVAYAGMPAMAEEICQRVCQCVDGDYSCSLYCYTGTSSSDEDDSDVHYYTTPRDEPEEHYYQVPRDGADDDEEDSVPYYYTVPDEPETSPPTYEAQVPDTKPMQSAAVWTETQDRLPYAINQSDRARSSQLSLAATLFLGSLVCWLLVAIISHFERIGRVRKTDDAINKAAVAAAVRKKLEDAAREADELINHYRKQSYRKGRGE